MTRTRARVDDNQREVVEALRKAGASVVITSGVGHGCWDLIVGYQGQTALVEVKDGHKPESQQRLTDDEYWLHQDWRGGMSAIVRSAEEAIGLLRQMGREGASLASQAHEPAAEG